MWLIKEELDYSNFKSPVGQQLFSYNLISGRGILKTGVKALTFLSCDSHKFCVIIFSSEPKIPHSFKFSEISAKRKKELEGHIPEKTQNIAHDFVKGKRSHYHFFLMCCIIGPHR